MCLGIPGRVIDRWTDENNFVWGKVDFGGAVREVNLSLTPEAKIGDYVVVHVGFSISVLDEKEALEVLDLLKNM